MAFGTKIATVYGSVNLMQYEPTPTSVISKKLWVDDGNTTTLLENRLVTTKSNTDGFCKGMELKLKLYPIFFSN